MALAPPVEPIEPPAAIVGMSCHFPGAPDLQAYWQLLASGGSGLSVAQDRGWPDSEALPAGYIQHWEHFDAGFFRLTPAEATAMDPQQRWLLMQAWQAIADAGWTPAQLKGQRVGVFVGLSSADYAQWYLQPESVDMHSITGLAASVVAHRISYYFDLKGPSLVVDTACSSALTALHLAQESLQRGECDHALVGAANALLSPLIQQGFAESGALSPTGQCAPFSAEANGMVRGEGAGMLLLTRKARPMDRVYAYVRGSAINQDGQTQGLTAPSGKGQSEVLNAAQQRARIAPESLFYIEAHGTGTPLGDPIEARALSQSIGQYRKAQQQHCAIGSVKGNLGHLEAAAGLAGLIKVALGLYQGQMPASRHSTTPHPQIPFERYGLHLLQAPYALGPEDRYAGVSAFGFGGGNAHVILQRAARPQKPQAPSPERNWPLLFPLSARSEAALQHQQFRLAAYLSTQLSQAGSRELWALHTRLSHQQAHHPLRRSFVAESVEQLQEALQVAPPLHGCALSAAPGTPPPLVFVFTGMGGQPQALIQSVQALYGFTPLRDTFVALQAAFEAQGIDLHPWMEAATATLAQEMPQDVQQVLTFCAQVLLYRFYTARGLQVTAVMGNSMGEVTAAYCAGLLTLSQAAELLVARIRLLQTRIGTGSLSVVAAAPEALELEQFPEVALASINGPQWVLVAGPDDALQAAEAHWTAQGHFTRRIPGATAPSHTPWIGPLEAPLRDLSERVMAQVQSTPQPNRPQFWSTVSTRAEKQLPNDYWWHNVRETVRCYPTLCEIMDQQPGTVPPVFFECSAQALLSPHLQGVTTPAGQPLIMGHSALDPEAPLRSLLAHLGWFWERGFDPLTDPLHQLPAALHDAEITDPLELLPFFPSYAWDLKAYAHAPRTLTHPLTHPLTHTLPPTQAKQQPRPETLSPLAQIQALSPAAARQALPKLLQQELSEVLQQPVDQISLSTPLKHLGIGSLVGMELYHRLQKTFEISLPLSTILQGPSLETLAEQVWAHWQPGQDLAPDTRRDTHHDTHHDTAPLSPAQLRFWLMDQWLPGLSYHIPVALRLTGPLDVERLKQAFEALCQRHVLLRTIFQAQGGEAPQQRTVAQAVQWQYFPAAALPEAEIPAQLADHARQPFDYTTAPPFRVSLWQRGPESHDLLIDMHHLIADGYSFRILYHDLRRAYAGEHLTPQSPDFYDYARQHPQATPDDESTRHLQWWVQQLHQVPHFLALPTDFARPPQLSSAGRRYTFTLHSPLVEALEALAQDWGVSLFSILMAAFQVLLYRASGQSDFVVGTPVLGRPHWQWQEVVGPFLNLLPLRATSATGHSLQSFTRAIHEHLIAAFDHQHTAFESLIEALQPERRPDWSPLVQVVLALHAEVATPDWEGPLSVRPQPFDLGVSRFDLALTFHPHSSSDQKKHLEAAVEYRSSLFHENTIRAYMTAFTHLLHQWTEAAEPDLAEQSVHRLCLQADPQKFLKPQSLAPQGVEPTSAPPARPWKLWHALEARAQQQPEHLILSGVVEQMNVPLSVQLSARELWQRAQRLAQFLQGEQLVATALPVGPDLIIAWLGISLAGAAYSPLPAEQSAALRQSQLAALQPTGLLSLAHPTHPTTTRTVPEGIFFASLTYEAYKTEDTTTDTTHAEVEDLAYVMLTSGTTGQPKPVQVLHRNLQGLMAWHHARYFDPHDTVVVAQWANPIFDAASWEIWSVLTSAHPEVHLHCLPEATRRDPQALDTALRQVQASHCFIASDFLHHCFAQWQQPAPSLRVLLTGGSVLRQSLPPHWHKGLQLHLHYGPTESTVVTSVVQVHGPEDLHLGEPLPGQKMYLLDPQQQPLPRGFHGQLALAGPLLAQGYRHLPEQTQAAFVALPTAAHERVYLTGDRVHARSDGDHPQLEYTGRLDRQVKVRGMRIEAAAVEKALCQLPEVAQAHVALTPQGKWVAWLVPQASKAATLGIAALASVATQVLSPAQRQQLAPHLSPAFYPDLCQWVAQFPLTPQGKIDGSALQKLLQTLPQEAPPTPLSTETPAAALTDIEALLAHCWQAVLGPQKLQTDSRFFALGGHSLSALELQHTLQTAIGHPLALHVLFRSDRFQDMVDVLQQSQWNDAAASQSTNTETVHALPPLNPEDYAHHAGQPFALTPVQQAYWIGQQTGLSDSVPAQAYLELRYTPALSLPRLQEALQHLIIRHPMLRMTLRADGRQQYREVAEIAQNDFADYLSYHDWRGLDTNAQESAHTALRQQLQQERPHFLRVAVVQTPEQVLLCLCIHALVADAISLVRLSEELERFYHEGPQAKPPLDLRFDHWQHYLAAHRHHPKVQADRQWWLARLAQIAPPPVLPEKPVVADEKIVYARKGGSLSRPQWERLQALARRHSVTPTCLLLSVFAACLGRWSQRQAMTLNLTTFSRPPVHPQMQDIVGDFTQLSLVSLTPQQDFWAQTQALQHTLLEVLAHGSFSGIEVMRALREAGQEAAFPVVFTSALGYGEATIPLQGEWVYSQTQTPQVSLDHQVMVHQGCLHYDWDYPEQRFDAAFIQTLFDTWESALHELLDIESLPQSICPWPVPAAAPVFAAGNPHGDLLVPFLEQCLEHPERLAVASVSERLSYFELWQRAHVLSTQLSAFFADQPTAPRRVALYMPAGWEQVVGVLATLMADACYIPLNSEWPRLRCEAILAQAECPLVLCHPTSVLKTESSYTCWTLTAERVTSPIPSHAALQQQWQQRQQQRPSDPVYLIFTSGSTGTPKGVVTHHAAVSNTLQAVNARLGLQPADRVLGLADLSFDLSVYDIFGALWAGAAVVYPDPAQQREPAHWWQRCQHEGVSVWNSVPAHMEMLCQWAEGQSDLLPLTALRTVLLSGDWIPVTLPARIQPLSSQPLTCLSLGGATEGAIWSIWHEIQSEDAQKASIPYGTAMPAQGVYVLDPWLADMPPFAPGELYLAGAGVAAGYLNQPDLTARHFSRHPQTGEALYRTGDLGYRNAGGEIIFLGREDQQVKIKGYRVELSEITHCAQQCEGVLQALALYHEKTLRLYWQPRRDEPSALHIEQALSHHLSTHLPRYMQPDCYISVSVWPLTANGKIHRQALLDQNPVLPDTPELLPPLSALQEQWVQQLRTAIATVLDWPPEKQAALQADTDLLSLGIHSLEMVQLSQHFQQTFGKAPGVGELLRLRTLRALAADYARQDSVHKSVQEPTDPAAHGTVTARPSQRVQLSDHPLTGTFGDPQTWGSHQDFAPAGPGREAFSQLLSSLRVYERHSAFASTPQRAYASAGGYYGVQVYLHLRQDCDPELRAGLWRYVPQAHALEAVTLGAHWPYPGILPQAWTGQATFGLYLWADLEPLRASYGSDARSYALLEAGAMTQLLRQAAGEHLGLCLLGQNDPHAFAAFWPAANAPEAPWLISMLGGQRAIETQPEEAAWEEWVI